MTIARNDGVGIRGNGALQNAVIIRIVDDDLKRELWVDLICETPESPSPRLNLFCAPAEFLREDAFNLSSN